MIVIMNEPPDLEGLARRYLDLWEAQLSALAGDPALAEQISRLVAAMGSAGFAATAAWSAAQGREQPRGSGSDAGAATGREPTGGTPAGAAPVSPAPDDRDQRLGELARRLAALEDRLAALEQPPQRRPRKRTGGTARKPG
jgi:hypothetical protein